MRDSPSRSMPRSRKVRILATLGPASNSRAMILKLAEAGADAFRVNMSHGTHKDHQKLIETVRSLEKELDRPTTILADLQGPKLRVDHLVCERYPWALAGRVFAADCPLYIPRAFTGRYRLSTVEWCLGL